MNQLLSSLTGTDNYHHRAREIHRLRAYPSIISPRYVFNDYCSPSHYTKSTPLQAMSCHSPHSYHMLCSLLPFHYLYLRLLLRCGKSLRQTTKADSNNYYSSRLILSPIPTIPSDPATHYRHDHHDYISPFPLPCTGTSQPRRPRQTTARPQSSSSTPLNILDKDC